MLLPLQVIKSHRKLFDSYYKGIHKQFASKNARQNIEHHCTTEINVNKNDTEIINMYLKPLHKLNSSSSDLIFNYITELHIKVVEENEHTCIYSDHNCSISHPF